jgi:hypothetical protein
MTQEADGHCKAVSFTENESIHAIEGIISRIEIPKVILTSLPQTTTVLQKIPRAYYVLIAKTNNLVQESPALPVSVLHTS